jgi:two-component system NtrC family sensor kinase
MAQSSDSRAKEALSPEQAIAHLAAIVESSDDAIISKTLDGIILSWNIGAQRLYGYTEREAIGQSMTLLLPPDRAGEESGILERIARGERVEHFETVRRRKTGELIDVSLTISPIRDAQGRIIGASHMARNTSERRRLDEESGRLAAIVQSSDDAIVSKTLDGVIVTWNRGGRAGIRLHGGRGDRPPDDAGDAGRPGR